MSLRVGCKCQPLRCANESKTDLGRACFKEQDMSLF